MNETLNSSLDPSLDPEGAPALIQAHIDHGRLAEGEALARTVLDQFPAHYPVLLALGGILERTARGEEAVAVYERASAVNPGSGRAFTRRAVILLRRHWGAAPAPRAPAPDRRIMCSALGTYGRFANQLLQYAMTRLYAEDHGLTAEFTDWIGRDLFGFDDPLLGAPLPELSEKDADLLGALSGRDNRDLAGRDLWGYFQKDSRDFAGHRDRFRRLFTPRPELAAVTEGWRAKLNAGGRPLVALHLRRGDFVTNRLWTAPEDWYLAWLAALWPRLERPLLYIATDDPGVVAAFKDYAPVTADALGALLPGAEFYADFHILTQATHLAISNSSFSFVAAMLNQRGEAFVRPDQDARALVSFDPWNAPITLAQDPTVTEGEGLARQILDAIPDHLPAMMELGAILEAKGASGEALGLYERAIAAHPHAPEPRARRAAIAARR